MIECPACRRQLRSTRSILKHIVAKHPVMIDHRPEWCGWYACGCGYVATVKSEMVRHIESVGDLRLHFATAALREASSNEVWLRKQFSNPS